MYKIILPKLIGLVLCSALLVASAVSANELRDPTKPLGLVASNKKAVTQWVLNSVLISPQRKLAVINGHTLREGQILPGSSDIKVQRILANTVVLQQAANTWALTLSPSVVKKHSTIKHNN